MAAAAPVPVPDPAAPTGPATSGSIFDTYDPAGAMGGLFAPAYIHGYKPSEDAVAAWQAQNRGVNADVIEQSRMPATARPSTTIGGDGVYGGPLPQYQIYGDPRGTVDPAALRAASLGGHYDLQARRDAIAARIAANNAAMAPQPLALASPSRQYDDNPTIINNSGGYMATN